MNNRRLKFLLIVLVLILTILACGKGDEPEPTATSEPAAAAQPEEDAQAEVEEAPAAEEPAEPEEAAEEPVSMGEDFRSEEGGYAFAQIPGWTVDEFLGFATLMPEDADEDSETLIYLMGGLSNEEATLDQAYDEFMEEPASDENVILSEPKDITINGVKARRVNLSGTTEEGQPMAGSITVAMVTPAQFFSLFGSAPEDEWNSEVLGYYDAVLDSVSFFEPVVAMEDEIEEEVIETEGEELRQWAASATASSQYDDPDWSATQAAGEPDTYPACEDAVTAWASSERTGVDWLELTYDYPVLPTEITVYETYSPNSIVSIDVVDTDGGYHEVAAFTPEIMDCPYLLVVPVTGIDFEITGVRLNLDQSILDASWNEIDAVELVGLSQVDVAMSPAEEEADEEVSGSVDIVPQEGFLWQAGGDSGFEDDQLGVPDGMFVDSNGFLYVADRLQGVWFFNNDGTFGDELLESETFNNSTDVAVSTQDSGYIAVASWGNQNVSVFDFNGNLLTSFGEEGNGPGQFGGFSPQDLAMDMDHNIYVLDHNEDDNEESFDRVQVFDIDGNYLYEWLIDEEFFSAVTLRYWTGPTPADDRIFVLGFIGGYILEYDLDGNLIGRIGEDALDFKGPQDFDIDDQGNFYVLVWTPDSVLKLDHDGNLIAEWGISVEDDEGGVPAGAFYNPFGLAVHPDGSVVYVSEWTGDYAYVTAFEFK